MEHGDLTVRNDHVSYGGVRDVPPSHLTVVAETKETLCQSRTVKSETDDDLLSVFALRCT